MKPFPARFQNLLCSAKRSILVSLGLVALGAAPVAAQTTPELRGDVHFVDGAISVGATYDVFTGRIRRRVVDLVVPGSVGQRSLTLERVLYNMPYQGTPAVADSIMGCSAPWNFNVQGYRVAYGLMEGNLSQYEMSLIYPDGTISRITEISSQESVIFFGTGDRVFLDGPGVVRNLVLQDGSVVNFTRLDNFWFTSTITDPYGVVTTYSSASIGSGQVEYRITDQSGRWVRLIQNVAGPYPVRAESSSGDSVIYTCDRESLATSGYTYSGDSFRLLTAAYADGTKATYSYKRIYNGQTYLGTLPYQCYDVRSSDAMQSVEYSFDNVNRWTSVTRGRLGGLYGLESLRLPGSSVPVTSRSLATIPGVDGGGYWLGAAETRGGSAAVRKFLESGLNGLRMQHYVDGEGNSTAFSIKPASSVYDSTAPAKYSSNPDVYPNVANYTSTDALGRVTTVRYLLVPKQYTNNTNAAAIENPAKITNPDGTSRQIIYTDPVKPYYIAKTIDENGNTTVYTRNSKGQVTKITYADTSSESWTYNSYNQPLTHVLRNGATEWWDYDNSGLLVAYWLPSLNGKTAVIRYTYYPIGHVWVDRVKTVTDPNGNATTTEYDMLFSASGVQTTTPCAGLGRVTKVTYANATSRTFGYDSFGHKIWEKDEAGNSTTYTYDGFGRLVTTTDPNNRTSKVIYGDTDTERLGFADDLPKYTLTPLGSKVSFSYDKNRRLVGKVEAVGSSAPKSWKYVYDTVGNMLNLREQVGGSTGAEVWRDSTWEYDNRNRKIVEHLPLGRDSDFSYDAVGNVIMVTHPDDTYTSKVYNSMNQVKSSTDEMKRTTTYTYYPSGLVQYIIDPKNNQYTHTYDAQNRLVTFYQTNPDGTGWEYEQTNFDPAGNVIGYRNRSGNWKTLKYDNRNREISTSWDDGKTPSSTTSYDTAGRILSRANANSTLTYSYDAAGQLIQEKQAVTGGPTKILDYSYDLDGRRTKMRIHTKTQ